MLTPDVEGIQISQLQNHDRTSHTLSLSLDLSRARGCLIIDHFGHRTTGLACPSRWRNVRTSAHNWKRTAEGQGLDTLLSIVFQWAQLNSQILQVDSTILYLPANARRMKG